MAGWEYIDDSAESVPDKPAPRGGWQRFKDSFSDATQHGFPGVAARKLHDWLDTSKEELRKANPDASDDELEVMADNVVSESQKELRRQYAEKAEADPAWKPDEGFFENIFSGRWVPAVGGALVGSADPTNLVMPGGSAAARIGLQGAIAGGSDVVYQGLDVNDGVAEKIDPGQAGVSALAGAGFQGVVEGLGAMVKRMIDSGASADEIRAAVSDRGGNAGGIENLEENIAVRNQGGDARVVERPEVTDELDHVINAPRDIVEPGVQRYNEPAPEGEIHPEDMIPQPRIKTAFEDGRGMDEREFKRYQRRLEEDRRVAEGEGPDGVERRVDDRRAEVADDRPGYDDTYDFGPEKGGVHDIRVYEDDELRKLIEQTDARRAPAPVEPPKAANDAPGANDTDRDFVIDALDDAPGASAEALQARLQAEERAEWDADPTRPVRERGPEWYAARRALRGGGDEPPKPPRDGDDGDLPPGEEPDRYVGNINLDNLNTSKDVEDLLRGVQDRLPPRRRISQDETRKRADELGLTERQLLESNGLEGVEAQAVRARDLLKTAGEDTVRILDELSDLESPQAQLAITRLATLSEHVQGKINGPAGRLLNSLKIDSKRTKDLHTLSGAMATPRGRANVQRLLAKYRGDPEAIAKIARDAVDPTMRDKIFSYRYNMMLSGPATHVYNVLGTAANQIVDLAEHGFAVPLGALKKARGDDVNRVTGREVAARLMGTMVGARQGLANMKKAFAEGRPGDDASRDAMARGRVGNWEVPVKAMAAEDEFFRSVAQMSDIYGQAVRVAIREGSTGQVLKDRIQELIANPTRDMLSNAGEYSKRIRFQDDPSIFGQAMERLRDKRVGYSDDPLGALGSDVVNLAVPFVRTPDSLVRTAIRRSALGVLDGVNIADWKAGGARRDLAKSRIIMGSGVTAGVAMAALEGNISGQGPRDYKKRQALELTGWQPNAIKNPLDGKWYSYEGLEPLSHVLSGTATMIERWDDKKVSAGDYMGLAADQALGMAEVLTNSAWAESLGDLFKVISPGSDATRASSLNSFLAGIGSSFVTPAAVRQVNSAYVDPVSRDTRGDDSFGDRLVGRITSGIPGMSDNLPASRDALGRPIGRDDAIGPDIISRFRASLAENSPIAAELDRLMKSDPEGGIPLNRVPRNVDTKDFPIGRLTAEQHSAYQLATGENFEKLLTDAINSPDWDGLEDDGRRGLIGKLAKQARKLGREQAFGDVKDGDAAAEPAEDRSDFYSEVGKDLGVELTDFGARTHETQRSLQKYNGVAPVGGSAHETANAVDFRPRKGLSRQAVRDYFEGKGLTGVKIITKKHGSGPHWHVEWKAGQNNGWQYVE